MNVYSKWFEALRVGGNYNTMHYFAGDGGDTFEINFAGGYLDRSHVKAIVDDGAGDISLTFVSGSRVKVSRPVNVGSNILIFRDTPKVVPLALFSDGSVLNSVNLDRNAKQSVFIAAEVLDRFDTFGSSLETSVEQVSEALRTANDALSVATGIEGIANSALSTSNDALTTSKAAADVANSAVKLVGLMKPQLDAVYRRCYLESGLNVVPGSFQDGFTLTNTNDVAIDLVTGQAFSGAPGKYPRNTPTAGFTNRSSDVTAYCKDIPSLLTVDPRAGTKRAYVSSVNAGKQGGAGFFVFDSGSSSAEYGGTVLKSPYVSVGRWKRESTEDLGLYHFGAHGDGKVDDTQAVLDWLRWQLETGKTKPHTGSGDFLVTSQLPYFNRGSVFGSGFDTNFVVGLGDNDTLFDVPDGSFAYSWLMDGVRFTCASGGSLRCRIFNVNGSLRGAKLSNISTWEFSRPLRFGNNIWGNLVLDSVNLYRVSNKLTPGDIALEFTGNTLMGSNIEVIGAFDRLIQFSGSVFKLDGLNPSGSQSPMQAGSGILIKNARGGYVRSAWIEHIDANIVANGEGDAITVENSTNVVLENIHIPTGSVWFKGGSRNTVRNIEYFQNNAGLRLSGDAHVNVDSTALGNRNASTTEALRGYSEPVLLDGNNSGRGLLPNAVNPIAMESNVQRTNGALVTLTENKLAGGYLSGVSSATVETTANNQGVKILASVVPGKVYSVCVCVRKVSGELFMSTGAETAAVTKGALYVDRSDGADSGKWLKLNITVSSSTGKLEVLVRNKVAGTFILDAVDVYSGASTFNPSDIG